MIVRGVRLVVLVAATGVAACSSSPNAPADARATPDAADDAGPDTPWPTGNVILDGLPSPLAVAVDDTNVYWIELGTAPDYADGRVMKANKDGTNPSPLAEHQVRLAGLAIDGPDVFWTAWGSTSALDPTGYVATVPKAGGASPLVLASGFTGPSDVAVAGASVYFLTGEVRRVPRTGGTSDYVAWYAGPLPGSKVYSMNGPAGLVTDGARLYWSNANDDEIVDVALPDGGVPSHIATTRAYAFSLAVRSDYVYWTTSGDDGIVARAPTTGGDQPPLASAPGASGLATDGTSVYYGAGDGTIRAVDVATSSVRAIAGSQDTSPHSLAIDNTWVYWTNQSGTITRTAR